MHRIAFLGERRSLLMYRPAGFTLLSPKDAQEVASMLSRLRADGYAIVYVTEKIYRMASAVIDAYDGDYLPAVIILPGYGENGGEGTARLRAIVETAVGLTI